MRHVDEGTIHAWLDEQITDPAEAAWIDEHLRVCGGCRGRLADEQATFDHAQAMLAETVPSVERPSLEALVAQAGRSLPPSEPALAAASPRGGRDRWLMQAGWAASVAVAIGLGWTARELTGRDSPRQATPLIAELSVPAPADSLDRIETPAPTANPATGASAPAVAESNTPGRRLAAPESRRSDAAGPTAPTQRPLAVSAARPQDTAAQLGSAPPPALERARDAAVAEPAPAPPAAVAAPAPAAAPAAVARQETITVTADTATRVAATATAAWRSVPRTEAAARTGMPLYGIDGFEPQLTEVSGDGAQVRTLYRLSSGDQVAVVQQRAGVAAPPGLGDIQAAGRALTQAGRVGIAAAPTSPPARTWSSIRGGVRITLQTTSTAADLDALGVRLRVD
jgi:hypothetical protein